MTKGTARRARGSENARPRDIYAETTAKIVAELEAGRFPWVQPWDSRVAGGPGLPVNALTQRRYSGINVLFLWGAAIAGGYTSQGWLTFKQALEAGGNVRKGEKGTTVVYADRFIPEAEKARAASSGEDARAIPFLKAYTVFAVEQCEGLAHDRSDRPLPWWQGCTTLRDSRVFLLSTVPDSFDSRYFGPVGPSAIIGRAKPLWTEPTQASDHG